MSKAEPGEASWGAFCLGSSRCVVGGNKSAKTAQNPLDSSRGFCYGHIVDRKKGKTMTKHSKFELVDGVIRSTRLQWLKEGLVKLGFVQNGRQWRHQDGRTTSIDMRHAIWTANTQPSH